MCNFLILKKPHFSHGAIVFRRSHALTCPYAVELRQNEDIPVFAYLLTQPHILTTDHFLAQIHRRDNSLRHQDIAPITQPELLTDAVFKNLPESYQPIRQRYLASRYLSLSRTMLKQQRIDDATNLLKFACAQSPKICLRLALNKQTVKLCIAKAWRALGIGNSAQETIKSSKLIRLNYSSKNGNIIEYQIITPKKNYQVYFNCMSIPLHAGSDTEVTLGLLAAMKLNTPLQLNSPISPLLKGNLRQWMSIFQQWFPEYTIATINAPSGELDAVTKTGRCGVLFTGGVDSFYSFIKHREEITDLVYVHGYDIKLTDIERRVAVSNMGNDIARATGIRFIEVETDAVRAFRDYGNWGLQSHGIGLACAARHLSRYLDDLYFPSSFSISQLQPWGSNPNTDPLFTDEHLNIIHDGCEATRTEKIRFIAQDPLAQQHLRVCYSNVEGTYNCGKCEKCLRTQTTLYAIGELQTFRTFTQALTEETIKTLYLIQPHRVLCEENLRLLEERHLQDSDIYRAWQSLLSQPLKKPTHYGMHKLKRGFKRIFKKH